MVHRSPKDRPWSWIASMLVLLATAPTAAAVELDEAIRLFRTGRYDECASAAGLEIQEKGWRGDAWYVLKARADMARGRYPEAAASLLDGLRRYPASLNLHLLGRNLLRFAPDLRDQADEALATSTALIDRIVLNAPERYGQPQARAALGRYLIQRGADPKRVLEHFYDPAMKQAPEHADGFLAAAELALDKQDYALAAETLKAAPPDAAEDPEFHILRARALAEGDHAGSAAALEQALEINPQSIEARLMQVDRLIDAERPDEAAALLDAVDAVNPREPRAFAFRAVLAHLRNDSDAEREARTRALEPWPDNPEVDALIGRKLAQKYRFAESEEHLRSAVAHDPSPAFKIQLAETLLRLGKEDEGWKLVDEVFAADGYNVVAYNLTTLRDRLAQFRTIESDGLVVRMDPREADLYGDDVVSLLKEARAALSERYGAEPPNPLHVEIFPRKHEFAVRTFGLPGGDGLLGVCFGPVITAVSAAAQGERPSNWRAVLWHELCHAVTLSKTRNTMPRWLSEGISVYEEGLRDPAWATRPNAAMRAAVLEGSLVPLSRLSSAFLDAKSHQDVQLAYYESALAVEFLVQTAGFPALRGLLEDLGAGKNLDEALPARAGTSLENLDAAFAAFARSKVEAAATWEPVELPEDADAEALAAWVAAHPRNHPGWRAFAARLVADGKWDEAKAALATLQALDPDYVGEEDAPMLLAEVHRALGDAEAEGAALERRASLDGDATAVFQRLVELGESTGDWSTVARNARRLLAVNPLAPAPHRALAEAAERLGRSDEAIAACRALAALDDPDPAGLHHRLARLLAAAGRRDEARREALKALEDAPRFLDAHRLLLELVETP